MTTTTLLLDERAQPAQTDLLSALLALPAAPAPAAAPVLPIALPPLGDLLVTARARVIRQVPPAPPKRKPVPTELEVDLHVPVRRARETEAPVAFRVRLADPSQEPDRDQRAFPGVTAETPCEIRQWGGTLWVPVEDEDAGVLLADPDALARVALPSHLRYGRSDEGDVRNALVRWAEHRLLIGDRFHREIGEPCWTVKYHNSWSGHDSVTLALSVSARPGALLPDHYRADQRAHAEAAVRAYLDLAADLPLPRPGETIHEAADRREAEGGPAVVVAEEDRARHERRQRWACRLWGDNLALEIVDPAAVTVQFTPSPALPLRGTVKLEGEYVSTSPDILAHSHERPGFTLPAPAGSAPGTPRTRRLVPRITWELVDDADDSRTPLTDAEAAAFGLRPAETSYRARTSVERDRDR